MRFSHAHFSINQTTNDPRLYAFAQWRESSSPKILRKLDVSVPIFNLSTTMVANCRRAAIGNLRCDEHVSARGTCARDYAWVRLRGMSRKTSVAWRCRTILENVSWKRPSRNVVYNGIRVRTYVTIMPSDLADCRECLEDEARRDVFEKRKRSEN